MSMRMIMAAMATSAMFLVAASAVAKEAEKNVATSTHDGKVVSIAGNQLVMTSEKGQQHTHTLAANAEMSLDGKVCKAADLKVGTRIRVTTKDADKVVATNIEGIEKNRGFASHHRDGTFVSLVGNQLVMTGLKNKSEQTCVLNANAKVTCDGRICKSSDLKAGMRIRVTSGGTDPHAASQVEAIDKNLDFASL